MAKQATTRKPAAKKAAAPKEIIETPVATKAAPAKPQFEFKDRTYVLKGGKAPLTYRMRSKSSMRHPMFYFDEEVGYNRELRYASNQRSVFVDEQEGPATLEHIVFELGSITVPKEKVALQKLLSIYHPLKDNLYEEFDPIAEAVDEMDWILLENEAVSLALSIDLGQAEAILRTEYGSKVSKLKSPEIKRDVLLFAKQDPQLFIALANDENVELRNVAVKAAEQGIVKLSQDQRTFNLATNGQKLMTVPYGENPYSALAAFFKTDEGVDLYQSVMKKIV